MEKFTIAGLQFNIQWENVDENLMRLSALIESTFEKWDLLVLPEMFQTGFTMSVANLAEFMDGKSVNWMQKTASTFNMAICGSIIVQDDSEFFNRFIFSKPDGKIEFYDKRHLFTLAGEHEVFQCGKERKIWNFRGFKIMPQVCYDLRFPVWSRNDLNYDLLLYVASWPDKRIHAWRSLLKARAIENQSFVLGINRVGTDGTGLKYAGFSSLTDYTGETICEISNEETFIVQTITKYHQDKFRKKLAFLQDRDSFDLHV